MKKIILATVLLVAISITSFAGEKDVDVKLLNDLTTTLKSSVQVHWTNKDDFSKAAFKFNDKTAYAFYRADNNELIGFAVQFNKEDLPAIVSEAFTSKYSDWELKDAIIFIDHNGYINYYAQVEKDKKGLNLKITPNGTVSVYNKYIARK
jgi:opacity protein-like surface antigen